MGNSDSSIRQRTSSLFRRGNPGNSSSPSSAETTTTATVAAAAQGSKPYLLYVTVSPMGEKSRSLALGELFLTAFKESHPDVEIKVKDLSTNPIPHLDGKKFSQSINQLFTSI